MTSIRHYIDLVESAGRESAGKGSTFYHGTSSTRLTSIQKVGLTPQTDPGSAHRHNGSTIQGWTENNVYLSATKENAWHYAKKEAAHTGGEPVVLEVAIPNKDNLVPDDDFIINAVTVELARQNGWEPQDGWEIDDAAEGTDNASGIMQAVPIALTASLKQIADAAYYDIPYARRLRAAVKKAMATPLSATLAAHWHNGAVAYRGTIPPNMLRVVE